MQHGKNVKGAPFLQLQSPFQLSLPSTPSQINKRFRQTGHRSQGRCDLNDISMFIITARCEDSGI